MTLSIKYSEGKTILVEEGGKYIMSRASASGCAGSTWGWMLQGCQCWLQIRSVWENLI